LRRRILSALHQLNGSRHTDVLSPGLAALLIGGKNVRADFPALPLAKILPPFQRPLPPVFLIPAALVSSMACCMREQFRRFGLSHSACAALA
jgi:hypothetical protein